MTIPHTQEQSPQLGTFKHVCHGHILFNTIRDRTVYFSLLFVFVPFLIVVCFNFKDLVSKTHWILVACLVILTVLTVIYLLRTWLTEPGILPKTQTNVIIDKVVPNEMQKRIATLMVSVKNDKKEYIERTLEILPDAIHQTNIEGRTLLHIGCIFDMENIAKVLLSYNPDIFQIDSFGLSAIHYSACFPNSKVFPLLCQFLQWESSTWENHKQELLKEVYQHIPQYSFEKNCYFIQTPDGVIENEDISAFFLPVPVSTLLQQTSSSSTNPPHIEVPYLCFICLSNHHIVNVLFCDSCKHFIPPRGFHCRKCDICIRTFDHHCPWMSNCIGLRNHSLFIWFLIWSVITCVVGVAVMSVYFISYLIQFLEGTEPFNFWGFVGKTWSCILYGCCCIGFIAPLVNLLLYHIQISLKNETTHEELMLPSGFEMRDKCENKEKYYPYSEGWKKNLKNALFCRIPSSLVNLQSTSV